MRRFRWALLGAVWISIFIVVYDAYRWSLRPALTRMFLPDLGPDGSRQFFDSPWNGLWMGLSMYVLPRMLIAAVALGVLVAGWWVLNRWRTKRAELSTS